MVAFTWHAPAPASEPPAKVVSMKAAVAEMMASAIFVFVGCGAACANGASDGETNLVVAFTFGIGILVLASAVGHHSGGQINGAVTFSLCLGGELPWLQGAVNVAMQLLGSTLGACLLMAVFPCHMDKTKSLGSNIINHASYSILNVLVAEAMGTFVLCTTVWEVAVSPLSKAGALAVIPIGFAVFLAHTVMLPIDGCSINPTRSFGPALVSHVRGCAANDAAGMRDLWVMCVGPLLGAAASAGVAKVFRPLRKVAVAEEEKGLMDAA